ncbi:MAG: MBL fold metallo-hydrolase [Anaerolineales bacterium]
MSELIVLGSASSIADVAHANTHLAIRSENGVILIDCVGSPTVRLGEAGIELDEIDDLILTHFHPDHVSGVPLMLMNMWLTGRRKALRIYGLHHCLKRLEDMMGFYAWENWPEFFPVAFHRLPDMNGVTVLKNEHVCVRSAPVRHLIPTLGLRIDAQKTGGTVAYSCDTEPCEAVVQLADNADILLHEASGFSVGHSSPAQAGEVAQAAGVGQLLLIHYDPAADPTEMIEEARAHFTGQVDVALDLMRIAI